MAQRRKQWAALLSALPLLNLLLVEVVALAPGMDTNGQAAACKSAGHHLELQLKKEVVSKAQAAAWSSEWVQVVGV